LCFFLLAQTFLSKRNLYQRNQYFFLLAQVFFFPKKRKSVMRTIAAIPCYNEALAIGSVVLKLKLARKYVDEVLVVDDGSTDDTVEVARRLRR